MVFDFLMASITSPWQYEVALENKAVYETSNKNTQKPPLIVVKALADKILKDPEAKEEGDVWQSYKSPKDCEDYALEMQNELARYGYGNQFSNLIIVQLWNGEYHVVLEVQTEDKGLIYFDNLKGISNIQEEKVIKRQVDGYKNWKTEQELF